ncbi:CoB--CoM heterodisulfide reductase iron-sulfur subunit B family protein [Candidatus Woesearchaeota archaeon]|nr:CoB--CoM heterodisulfide reductase iron-sulfur subunit B family protein [Candidatus Woesearchaeota archaeon]
MKQLKFAYFPGCVSRGACKELYDSTAIVAKLLGIELVELKNASCCGAGVIEERNPKLADSLNARNLAMAEQLGLPMLTHCSTCQGVFSKANQKLKEDIGYRAEINNLIGHEGYTYNGTADVRHLLWVLVEDIGVAELKKRVVRPLKGLKLSAFYGCYLLRPSSTMKFENPHYPTSMEDIFAALGAEPIFYSGRLKCCGFPISMINKESSFRMAGGNLLEAKGLGSDAMVTPCPLCHLNLDSRQPEVASFMKQKIDLPVLHLSQLVALALGADPKELKLDRHIVNTHQFLRKLGL